MALSFFKMRRKEFELDYWPSVADFMLGLFILAIVTGALLMIVQHLETLSELKGTIFTRISMDRLRELKTAERERDQIRNQVNSLQSEIKSHGKPPIIILEDADRFNFNSGSAEIAEEFRETLRQKHFPELLQTIKRFPTVDTIEVIGHTDSSIVNGKSNLDRDLVPFLRGQLALQQLSAGSNADLGLLRALAIRTEWYAWLRDASVQLPRSVTVRCYSAANTAPVDSTLLGVGRDDRSRRIEIRFTQLKQ